MSRRARIRFMLAAVALALAGWIGLGRVPDRLDKPAATMVAAKLLAAYARETGEPAVHFTARGPVDYPDGWEFSWSYAPCPEIASLRVFIGRDGRANYAQTPDCAPAAGLMVPPARV